MSSMDQRVLLSKLHIRAGQRMKTLFHFTVSIVLLFYFLPPHPPPFFSFEQKHPTFQRSHKMENLKYTSGLKKFSVFTQISLEK